MTFKLSRGQLAEQKAIATDLRERARALNVAIIAFNQGIGPLCRAVGDALDDYNEVLAMARGLTDCIADTAREEFEAKSERWQDSENGTQVRHWLEQWEMSLDDVQLEIPEPLEEIDPEGHAGEIEDGPQSSAELEPTRTRP
jgi:hypothetical protein